MPPSTSSTSFPFQPAWVYGACSWEMLVRGSVEPPASPLRKGPQPWSTSSKSSWTTVFSMVAGALATMRTSSARTVAALPAAASTRRVVRPLAGAVKFTFARWKYVPCQSDAAT